MLHGVQPLSASEPERPVQGRVLYSDAVFRCCVHTSASFRPAACWPHACGGHVPSDCPVGGWAWSASAPGSALLLTCKPALVQWLTANCRGLASSVLHVCVGTCDGTRLFTVTLVGLPTSVGSSAQSDGTNTSFYLSCVDIIPWPVPSNGHSFTYLMSTDGIPKTSTGIPTPLPTDSVCSVQGYAALHGGRHGDDAPLRQSSRRRAPPAAGAGAAGASGPVPRRGGLARWCRAARTRCTSPLPRCLLGVMP